MLEIGDAWKDWVGFSELGTAYLGTNSIPIRVCDNVYQIKCLCSKACNSQEYETKYLQFNLSKSLITLHDLENLRCDYIRTVDFYGYKTNNLNVYLVEKFDKPKNVRPNKYNVKNINSMFNRLQRMSLQKKPILK